jgi:hypothetical protein
MIGPRVSIWTAPFKMPVCTYVRTFGGSAGRSALHQYEMLHHAFCSV